MRISVMGKDLTPEEIAEIEEPVPDAAAYFSEPTVSAQALDAASRVVPEEVWKPLGLHTWLQRRACEVFKKMPVRERSAELGRLRYIFEYANDTPVLKTVVLINS